MTRGAARGAKLAPGRTRVRLPGVGPPTDDDPPTQVLAALAPGALARLAEQAFQRPAFQLSVVSRASAAREVARSRPQLVVAELADLTAAPGLLQATQRLVPPAPILALAQAETRPAQVIDGFAIGADDVVVLPVEPEVLRARARAFLRWTATAGGSERGSAGHLLSGPVGEEGALPLIKYCEAQRLSGRLTVASGTSRCWADFLGGEMVGAGGDDPASDSDYLAQLLGVHAGSFTIEQRPLASLAGGDAPTRAAAVEPADVRLTHVEVAPHLLAYEIETRGTYRPTFAVTTLVRRGTAVLRRTRREWKRPLVDATDRAAARLEIEEQHERVAAAVRAMATERVSAPTAADTVDATLLSWAIHFVVEQAWAHLGTTITTSLLRRTQAALLHERPALASFRVGDRAQIELELTGGPALPGTATSAVAAWLVAFLREGSAVIPEVAQVNVRQATSLMANVLERVGFYRAFEHAGEPSPR